VSYVDQNLMPQETVIYRAKLHWSIYCKAILLFGVAILAFIVAVSPLCHPSLVSASHPALSHASRAALSHVSRISVLGKICNGIGLVFVFFGFISFLRNLIKAQRAKIVVTNKRVIIWVGVWLGGSLDMPFQKIENVAPHQGVLGAMLGYGDITISGIGGTKSRFDHIADPLEFRRQFLSAEDSSMSRVQ